MKTLQVTSEWLSRFHSENIQLVTTIDNRELFTKTISGKIQGNHLNYSTILKSVEGFIYACCFLKIEKIKLVWTEKLENDNFQILKQNNDFYAWKENVLKGNYEIENLYGQDFEDSTSVFYNYVINVDGEILSLYKYDQTEETAIYFWYNPQTDTTNYLINVELRKALFVKDNNFDFHLPDSILNQNKSLLNRIGANMLDGFLVI